MIDTSPAGTQHDVDRTPRLAHGVEPVHEMGDVNYRTAVSEWANDHKVTTASRTSSVSAVLAGMSAGLSGRPMHIP